MKRTMKMLSILFVLGLLLSACQAKKAGIEAHEVWARAAIKDGNGAVYMVLHNHSDQADELIGASSGIARTVELHKSEVNDQGVMVMLKQEAIPLPARGEIILQPGGYHIMLIGLNQDLKEGDTFQVVLNFKNGPDIPLQVTVKGGGMQMESEGHHDHGSGSNDQGHDHDKPMSSPTP